MEDNTENTPHLTFYWHNSVSSSSTNIFTEYYSGQVEEKKSKGQAGRQVEQAAQEEHFQVWDKFWGRPGYGAPRQSGQHKENLMKMLHYPKQVTDSNNKHPFNHVRNQMILTLIMLAYYCY